MWLGALESRERKKPPGCVSTNIDGDIAVILMWIIITNHLNGIFSGYSWDCQRQVFCDLIQKWEPLSQKMEHGIHGANRVLSKHGGIVIPSNLRLWGKTENNP